MEVSIIIVSFNTKGLLSKCLASIRDYAESKDYEVIVVDNASNDGTSQMLKDEFPQVKLVANSQNLGFAKANNLGIRAASPDSRYWLFLNPDTVVQSETLPEMIKFMDENPQVAVSTCKVELPNGQIDIDCHRGFPTPWAAFTYFSGLEKLFRRSKVFGQYHQTWKDFATIHEIDSAVGAFMLVRRKAAEEVGWWDEDYFFYGEDIDWCYRFKQRGWKIMYNPTVKIVHYKGAASGIKKTSQKVTRATPKSRRKALQASVEAMRIFYEKHYERRYPSWMTFLTKLGITILTIKRIGLGALIQNSRLPDGQAKCKSQNDKSKFKSF